MRILGLLILLSSLAGAVRAQDWRIEVNHAIDRGVVDLLRLQLEDGSFETPVRTGHANGFPMGVTSLAVYTLLKSGLPEDDPAIRRAIDFLRYKEFKKVYSVALLVLALDATHDKDHREWILRAAAWLEDKLQTKDMRWAYPEGQTDLSNTQYAVLALRAAEKWGHSLDAAVWRDLATRLVDMQNPDGGFGYRGDLHPESSGSMTTAGITVLHLACERLADKVAYGAVRRRALNAIEKAWGWMDARFTTTGNPADVSGRIRDIYPGSDWHHYYLYGLERIATFAAREEIGGRDWYREGAIYLLGKEKGNGGWYSMVDTCFALLFLRRATFTSTNPAELTVPPDLYWRFTETEPPAGWLAADFNDATWLRGAGPIGTGGSSSEPFRTGWRARDIWMRRGFWWKKETAEDLRILVLCDDKATVWINGVEAGAFSSWSTKYRELKIGEEARRAIKVGRNLVCVRGENPGGEGAIDVVVCSTDRQATMALAWNDRESRFRWWKDGPEAAAPFLKRWLVLGPIPDSKGIRFAESLLPDEAARPKRDRRDLGLTWKIHESTNAFVDLGEAAKERRHSLYYAFTWLQAKKAGRYLLWVGADDGVAVWVDGKQVLRHFREQEAKIDAFPIEMKLDEGLHPVLIKSYNEGGRAGFYARATDGGGKPTEDLAPTLDAAGPDMAVVARLQPELFPPERLLELLETDTLPRIDFNSERDVQRLAIGPSRHGWPRVVQKSLRSDAYRPNPGTSGLLMVWPLSPSQPTMIWKKAELSRDEHEVTVKLSPEAYLQPGVGGVRLRVGVFDGRMQWLAGEELRTPERPGSLGWARVETPITGYAGKTVLIGIEISALGTAGHACAWIDEISLR